MLIQQLTKADVVQDDFLIPAGIADSLQKPVSISVGQLLQRVPRGIVRFDEMRSDPPLNFSVATPPANHKIVYHTLDKRFYAVYDAQAVNGIVSTYYSTWPTSSSYQTEDLELVADCLFVDAEGTPYLVADSDLKPMTSSPKIIDEADLDTMGTDGSREALDAFVADGCTRFAVTIEGIVAGYVDIMSDSMRHRLTQVLTTHQTFEDGALTDAHSDSRVRTYFRSYGLRSGGQSLTVGEWSPWRELAPESMELNSPIRCADEAELQERALLAKEGQQFYIPEED